MSPWFLIPVVLAFLAATFVLAEWLCGRPTVQLRRCPPDRRDAGHGGDPFDRPDRGGRADG